MSLVTGLPIPFHLPVETITTSIGNIPSFLGIIDGSPSTDATYTLPALIPQTIVDGAVLIFRNVSTFTITLIPAPGTSDTIEGLGNYIVAPAFAALLFANLELQQWGVSAFGG